MKVRRRLSPAGNEKPRRVHPLAQRLTEFMDNISGADRI
jgi:hypothetical protein